MLVSRYRWGAFRSGGDEDGRESLLGCMVVSRFLRVLSPFWRAVVVGSSHVGILIFGSSIVSVAVDDV